nr:carboxypeptidase-like regulatory domain-containing protein [Bacteroidota bacterium]
MKIKFVIFLSIIICLTHLRQASGQGIRGLITDTKGQAIPFSTIYIKELKNGTTSNINGEFEIKLPKGDYTIIIRNLGFKPVTKKVPVNKKFVLLNVTLEEQIYQIKEVRISSKGEDPAYAIMRKAIGLAPYHLNQV